MSKEMKKIKEIEGKNPVSLIFAELFSLYVRKKELETKICTNYG